MFPYVDVGTTSTVVLGLLAQRPGKNDHYQPEDSIFS